MKLPDCKYHNPDPQYLRDLLEQAGLSQRKFAKRVGIPARTFHDHLNRNKPTSKTPYPVQFCLEIFANNSDSNLPDCKNYNPDPLYLRDLLEQAGLSQRGFAKLIGINERTFRRYLNEKDVNNQCSYPVQFCLETLAGYSKK